jgi:hypothetical protein
MEERRLQISLSGSGFFGLTQQYREFLFSQIHDIVFHGKGGYDWHTVYNMPIWLRNFTFHKLKEHYEKQNEEVEKAKIATTKKKQPTFITKASK